MASKFNIVITVFKTCRRKISILNTKYYASPFENFKVLRAVQSAIFFFLENVFIIIQNLIYGISIALEVNELHTFERS